MKIPTILAGALGALLLTACHAEVTHEETAGEPAPATSSSPAPSPAEGFWQQYERPSDDELSELLSPLAYKVTRKDGTERPFTSVLNSNKQEGLYVDVLSGEPLFSSRAKFDSGTGWPSFFQPIREDSLSTHTDYKLGYPRTEVRSAIADSHLGHVFEDGPQPTGLRYCINGVALRFVPVEELEAKGYGELTSLFE